MKVEVKQVEKKFEPIELVITIESEEEAKSILKMCQYNESIPSITGCDNFSTVQNFLNRLSNEIHKAL